MSETDRLLKAGLDDYLKAVVSEETHLGPDVHAKLAQRVHERRSAGSGDVSIHVLIADHNAVVRQDLRVVLATERDLEVVGEAADGEEAVRLARALRPDIVLMEDVLPGWAGSRPFARFAPTWSTSRWSR